MDNPQNLNKLEQSIDDVKIELYQLKRQFKDSLYNIDEGNFSDSYNNENKYVKNSLNQVIYDVEGIKRAKIGSNQIKQGAIKSLHIGTNAISVDNLDAQMGKQLDIWENDALVYKLDKQNATSLIDANLNSNKFELQQGIASLQTDVLALENIANKYRDELAKYIRIKNNALELGSTDSPFKVQLQNNSVNFINANNSVGSITGNGLNISHCHTQSISLGNFQIYVDSKGLSLVKH